MAQTTYGFKRKGRFSRFIIVAPYGANEDINTDHIAPEIAGILKGAYVVNNKFKRSDADFGRLPWENTIADYRWQDAPPIVWSFYSDILSYVQHVAILVGMEEDVSDSAVVAYIRTMHDWDEPLGIDIGIGAKYDSSVWHFNEGVSNGGAGQLTMPQEDAKALRDSLETRLRADGRDLDVAIGKYFPAWDKHNTVQLHAPQDIAVQFSICESLASNADYVASIIADSLSEVYTVLND